eukprot:352938-Chlamydomonas_euryale.AAC.5
MHVFNSSEFAPPYSSTRLLLGHATPAGTTTTTIGRGRPQETDTKLTLDHNPADKRGGKSKRSVRVMSLVGPQYRSVPFGANRQRSLYAPSVVSPHLGNTVLHNAARAEEACRWRGSMSRSVVPGAASAAKARAEAPPELSPPTRRRP